MRDVLRACRKHDGTWRIAGRFAPEKLLTGCTSYCGGGIVDFGHGAQVALDDEICRLGGSLIWPSGGFPGRHVQSRARRDLQSRIVGLGRWRCRGDGPGAEDVKSDVVVSGRNARGMLQRGVLMVARSQGLHLSIVNSTKPFFGLFSSSYNPAPSPSNLRGALSGSYQLSLRNQSKHLACH
jgi:hypothetical protein